MVWYDVLSASVGPVGLPRGVTLHGGRPGLHNELQDIR